MQANHITIVVSNVSRSLHFYSNIIGMEQIHRPDFDREVSFTITEYCLMHLFIEYFFRPGAWLTFGNLDLHLVKGIPSVHSDSDPVFGHIAIEVESAHMSKIRDELQHLGWQSHDNISVSVQEKANIPFDQV